MLFREWAESLRGGHRIGEERLTLLSSGQRAFLAAAPDYRGHLDALTGTVEAVVQGVVQYEHTVCRMQHEAVAYRAAADRAFALTGTVTA